MRIDGRGESYGVLHLRAETEETLIDFLRRETRLEEKRLLELIDLGAVYLEGRRERSPVARVKPQSLIRLHSTPRRYEALDLRTRIVFEAADYLLLDKPSALPVHALTDNLKENVLHLLQVQLGRPLFITHRLDVETSGLLVVALTAEAQSRINSQIADRKVKRLYRAQVDQDVEVGEYVHFMEPSPTAPKRLSTEPRESWLVCRLAVRGSCRLINGFELDIELFTGRTQQIRAQLAALGAPILGDVIYGGKSLSLAKTIALRAYAISIDDRDFTLR